jgi:acetoin utilization protein AcuB
MTVAAHMTHSPHTIEADEPLLAARRLMTGRGLRHVPVVESGKLVGMLSERELRRFESLPEAASLKVEDAMSLVAYVVAATTLLKSLAVDLTRRNIEAAVVTRRGHVVGMFTAVDALRALAELLPDIATPLISPLQRQGQPRQQSLVIEVASLKTVRSTHLAG